jgi:hypothetical protein
MRFHRLARVTVAIWTRLLASLRFLTVGPSARRRGWRLCFRLVAVAVTVALCAGALVAVPARPALAAAIDPVNPGGDLTFSLSDGTVSPTFMTSVVTNYGPSYFGLPANPTASAMNAAVYKQTQSDDPQTPWAAPPTATGSTFTTSTNPPSVTYTAPASSVPASNIPAGLQGPLAALLTASVTTPTWYLSYALCLTGWGLANRQSVDPPGDDAKTLCGSLAGAAATMVGQAMSDPIANVLPDQNSWVKSVGAALITAALVFPNAKIITPWILNFFVTAGQAISNAVAAGLAIILPAWLPNALALVQQYLGNGLGANPRNRNLMNGAFALANMPTQVAEGAVINTSLGGPAYQCVDDWQAAGAPENGNPATINLCNSSDEQDWIQWSNNTLTNGGECLEITGASWKSKSPLEMYWCNGQWNQEWSQAWTFWRPLIVNDYPNTDIDDDHSGYSRYCVDDPNWDTTPGTQLQDSWCSGTTAQRWLMPGNTSGTGTYPTVTDYGPVGSAVSGECMDAYGSSDGASPGQAAAINGCNGNLAQDWTVWSDDTVSAWGLCLDASGSHAGALAELEDCDGAASQVWTPQSNGSLVDSASGLCLEDPGATTTAGAQLDLHSCSGAADQRWTLPPALPDENPPLPANASVCDLYANDGTPCVAAYSMTRAMYVGYDGPLYQVKRASDGTTQNIGLLAAGGYVNAAAQDSFCANTGCTVTEIYDQSPDGNNLTIAGPGGSTCSSAPGYSCSGEADHGADASLVPVTVDGSAKIEAYGLDITGGVGYADDATTGIATGSAPEGTYMVASGTNVNGQCCMDFGNAEKSRDDDGNGHMDAVRIGTGAGIPGTCWFTPCNGSGPWVGVDMENGTFLGANGSYLGNAPVPDDFVTAMAKNDGQSTYAIETGDAQSGGLTTQWSGALPDLGGYMPMQKEGGIVLGTGGDNSNAGIGTWFEGVMTSGYPSSAADAAVQANIVAAGYAGNSAGPAGTTSSTSASAGTAGQAVLHDGYTSVYTVNAKNGDLDETYLPAICAPNCAPGQGWSTQDLSATAGTPPVLQGTQPVALYHDGFTSVYTVDASDGHLDETYLAAICAPGCAPGQGWVTQDLSATAGAPPTLTTPSAVYHDGYVSVYTTDATSGDLQETYLAALCTPGCAAGQGWATQDLTKYVGTPRVMVTTAPVAVLHDGYVSVYTVDASDGHLDETYLAAICAPGCAPGQGWATQDLTKYAGAPPVMNYTSPVALFHDGFNSVYTVDASDGHLDETYLAAICAPNCAPGQGWATQDLSAHPGTPPTEQTPIALLHLDQSGGLNWVSVWTINSSSNHLDETYLPALCTPGCAPGQGWATQDLSVNPGTPPAT